MEEIILEVLPSDKDIRIDKFISENTSITRSYAEKLIKEGNVLVGEATVLKNYKTKEKDVITILMPEPEILSVEPENIPLDIVYEDEYLIVVNKPQGMVVHPAVGNYSGTLVNALLYHTKDSLSAINGVIRPGIVHRIDKDTSGLLVVAKDNDTHLFLSEQIKQKKANRRYLALVNGVVKEGGRVEKCIARHPSDRKKMAVSAVGRDAVTHYNVLENYPGYTLCECVLETGRTHQIRVHMASIGHSVVGDKTYGIKKEKFNLEGQLLHARTLGFVHPKTNEYMEFECPIPKHFEDVLEVLRKKTI